MPLLRNEINNNLVITTMNKNDQVQLNEIFLSIEGEGLFAGTKTLFIRFSGCHLKCYWCDTKYSLPFNSGNSYHFDEAKRLILQNLQPNVFKVNFTGGEPLLQTNALITLAKFVKNELNLKTYLESSCFDWRRFESALPFIDICKIEFKTKDSKIVEPHLYENLLINELKCLDLSLNEENKIAFVKIVFTDSINVHEIRNLLHRIFDNPNICNLKGFILQPSYQTDSPSCQKIMEIYDEVYNYYKDVRVIPQTHKLLGLE